jgi:hypothetical protein
VSKEPKPYDDEMLWIAAQKARAELVEDILKPNKRVSESLKQIWVSARTHSIYLNMQANAFQSAPRPRLGFKRRRGEIVPTGHLHNGKAQRHTNA